MDAVRGLRTYRPRMNASNHLRRAVSSLTRGIKGIVLAINAKDELQFLFRVLVGCVVKFNVGATQVQRGAPVSQFAFCS